MILVCKFVQMVSLKQFCGALAFALLISEALQAAPIAVGDPSFESNTLTSGGWSTDLSPEWSESGGPRNGNAFEEYIVGFSSNGTDHLGMNTGHNVWQDLSATYQANTIYTLTVAHGHRSGSTGNSNQSTFSLRASDNTVFASAFENSFSLAGSSFADSTPLILDTSATPAAVGQTIRIHLLAGGGGRSHFDNIRLDATEIEPDGTARLSNSAATAIGSSTAMLNGTVTDVGDDTPSITLFYGISDGGTLAGAWDSSVTIGVRDGNFSSSISSLLPGQSYFFAARATNSAGESWSIPSLDFETLPLPPTVSQSAASDITAISAQLAGSITDNGGDNATLTFYYGTSDGGTTPGNWGNSISLGIVNGTSSIEINGLTPTSSYFFRAAAANSGGIAWAPATGTFTTIAVTAPLVENRSAGGIAATSANFRGEVTDTGSSPPTVTIFFGTSDGGNDPNSWDSSISVGTESGNFSRFVSGLLSETTYFYTARASNAAGITWAPSSENFDTPAALPSQVVINEIHYDPANETSAEEFIELYNPGANAIDLSNWELTDAVRFTFPPGTTLEAGAYLVIAEDPPTITSVYGVISLGPWEGGLNNDGEEIDLRDSTGNVMDQVDYGSGFPWPSGARGGGGSIELLNPALDNDLGASWRTAGSQVDSTPETDYISAADSQWRYRKGTSEASNPIDGWRQIIFTEDGTWTTAQPPIGYGDGDDNTVLTDMRENYSSIFMRREFTIDPLEIPQNLKLRLYVDDGAIVWINGQEVQRAHVGNGQLAFNATASNHEAEWEEFILTTASNYLVGGTNVIAVQGFNGTLGSSDFSLDATLSSTSSTSSGGSPTPGLANGTSTTVVPPAIRQVDHTPQEPGSSEQVTITAKLTDPQGVGTVTLDYQIVEPGAYIRITDPAYGANWTTVTMVDDGSAGDTFANDSIYSVVLPGSIQQHRRLIRYRINFEDTEGAAAQVPYPDDEQPNFAYFVYDGLPSWSGSLTPGGASETFSGDIFGELPNYHLIANNTDVINSQYNGGSDGVHQPGTLVYDGRVYDHIEFENRGEASTYVSGKNKWRFHFNRARRFRARDNWGNRYDSTWTKLNLQSISSPWAAMNRGMAGLDEAPTMRLYGLAGVPSPRTHYFGFRVIDNAAETDPSDQYEGDVWGLYLAMEQPNGSFLNDRDLADGNVYKIEGGAGDKKEQGDSQTESSSDWNSFYSASNSAQTEQWWRDNMDMPGYYTMRSLNRLLGNVDIRIGYNHYFYHEPTLDQWKVIPWDLDMMWIAETHQAGVIRQQTSINNHSQLAIEFRNRGRELLDLVGSDSSATGGQIGQLIDEYSQMMNPTGASLTWSDIDAFMWNYHPRTRGNPSSTSGQSSHKNNFFRTPYTDSRIGGSYVRTLDSSDHEGQVNYILEYVTDSFNGNSWSPGNGIQEGYGYEYLKFESNDSNIPNKPNLTYSGPAGFPVNQLSFGSSSFSDPNSNGSFGKMRWRIAKIAAPGITGYESGTPRTYEVETVSTSPDFTTFTNSYTFSASAAEPGITYRVRVQHEDTSGRTSHWSDPFEFVAGVPSVDTWRDNLVISEIMYNPANPNASESLVSLDNDDFEFIELTNISDSISLDLSQLSFTQGITFDFSTATILSLEPGQSLVLVKNEAAFEARYGTDLPVAGVYPNSLSNGGEQVVLSYAINTPILDFTYDDRAPWPTSPDGDGYPLILIAPESAPDHALAASWTAGSQLNGTPGSPAPPAPSFTSWQEDQFTPAQLADVTISGPNADPDKDGTVNLLEYAFLSDPFASDPSGQSIEGGTIELGPDTFLTITFPVRDPVEDLFYQPQISANLDLWNEGTEYLIQTGSVDQGDGSRDLTYRSVLPLSDQNSQFFRVRVIRNEL